MAGEGQGPGGTWLRIHAAVRRIPRGRVATYAQIAVIAGFPGQPRLVGYALNGLRDGDTTPWHRVINIRGEISPRAESWWADAQRSLLEREGIRFTPDDKVSLTRYQWKPRASASGRRIHVTSRRRMAGTAR